jgi:hypothetical protein
MTSCPSESRNVDIPLLTLLNVNESDYIFNIKTDKNIRKTYFELQGESLEHYLLKKKLTLNNIIIGSWICRELNY